MTVLSTGIGPSPSAGEIARDVASGRSTASAEVERALNRIAALDGPLNACTRILADRARAKAAAVDRAIAAGRDPGPLAGVPFAVKDLFDIAGLPNTGGSASRLDTPAAQSDAEAVRRLEAAGAILVATCNMDEFAYGFVTVNAHYGATRNPHDPARLAGGSSGGSAAAVAGGLVPLALGSDTNGSIRVPGALCGIYGLKPTHGSLPMDGVLPFVASFDDIGPFTASMADCELAWRVLRGLPDGVDTFDPSQPRVGILGGLFAGHDDADLARAMDEIAHALGTGPPIELADAQRARSAAYLMTAYEGGKLHEDELRQHPLTFDPATRARLIAGAIMPAEVYDAALAVRREFLATVMQLFESFDVLIAPSTPTVAPLVDNPVMMLNGELVAARAHLGVFTQPLSFIGLPALTAPLLRPGKLPLGIQIVAAPGADAKCFAAAAKLEAAGVTGVSPPPSAVAEPGS